MIWNYRTISLSNVDYNIFAFTLTNGINQILDKVIPPKQTVKKQLMVTILDN